MIKIHGAIKITVWMNNNLSLCLTLPNGYSNDDFGHGNNLVKCQIISNTYGAALADCIFV